MMSCFHLSCWCAPGSWKSSSFRKTLLQFQMRSLERSPAGVWPTPLYDNDSNTGLIRSKNTICSYGNEITDLCEGAAIIKNNLRAIWHVPHSARSGTKLEGGGGQKKSPFRVPNVSPMTSFLLSVKLVILEGSSVWHRGVVPHTLWCMCQFSQGPPLPLRSSPVGQDLQPGVAPSLASGWQRVTGDGEKMDRAERGEDKAGTEGKRNTIWFPRYQSGAI